MTQVNDGLQAELTYISEKSRFNRRYVSKGDELNTGVYEPYNVFIKDARTAKEPLDLETSGFELVTHQSKITDWSTIDQVSRQYEEEIEEFIKQKTGADRVIAFGPMLRNVEPAKGGNEQPIGKDVHTDYTSRRAITLAEDFLKRRAEGEELKDYSHFICINAWRAYSPGPQNAPLAVCDGRSVKKDEGLANVMLYVDELPDPATLKDDLEDNPRQLEAFCFTYKPEHNWFYYSNMKPEELLLFTLYDSREQDAKVRKSCEIRTIAYFR